MNEKIISFNELSAEDQKSVLKIWESRYKRYLQVAGIKDLDGFLTTREIEKLKSDTLFSKHPQEGLINVYTKKVVNLNSSYAM